MPLVDQRLAQLIESGSGRVHEDASVWLTERSGEFYGCAASMAAVTICGSPQAAIDALAKIVADIKSERLGCEPFGIMPLAYARLLGISEELAITLHERNRCGTSAAAIAIVLKQGQFRLDGKPTTQKPPAADE